MDEEIREISKMASENISRKTIEKQVKTRPLVVKTYEKLLSAGCVEYNYNIESVDQITSDVYSVDWEMWFDLADNSDIEHGGVLLWDKENGHYINPVISIGDQFNVIIPDGKLITIHTHPSNPADDRCYYQPSLTDWVKGSDRGWQLVVTRWGIYAHIGVNVDRAELRGKCYGDGLNDISPRYRLCSISRDELGY